MPAGLTDRTTDIQYLRRRDRGISAEESDRLADLIGDLPMALEILATLPDTGMPRAELLAAFDETALEEAAGNHSPNYPGHHDRLPAGRAGTPAWRVPRR